MLNNHVRTGQATLTLWMLRQTFKVLALAALLLAVVTNAVAQQFHNLTAEEVSIDSVLPRFACSIPLQGDYADSTYTVDILYPEWVDMAEYSIRKMREVTDAPMPEMPVPEVNIVVEWKKEASRSVSSLLPIGRGNINGS